MHRRDLTPGNLRSHIFESGGIIAWRRRKAMIREPAVAQTVPGIRIERKREVFVVSPQLTRQDEIIS